ncbi:hypothetical protein [Dethiothermospora halolimnae]
MEELDKVIEIKGFGVSRIMYAIEYFLFNGRNIDEFREWVEMRGIGNKV